MHKMIQALIFCLFFGLSNVNTVSAAQIALASEKTIKEKREISDFKKIVISGSGHLFIKQGDKVSLTIEADKDVLPALKSEVNKDILYLDYKDTLPNFNQSQTINYHLIVKNIEDIQTAGEVEISSNGTIVANPLNISTEGAGKINLKVKTEKLNIHLAGNGDIILYGTTDNETFKIKGAGKIQAKKLTAKTAHVNIAGAGIAEVKASKVLDVKIEGVGTVKYLGTPRIIQEISGAGEIIAFD